MAERSLGHGTRGPCHPPVILCTPVCTVLSTDFLAMDASRIQFIWADAWILLSILIASRRSGAATLRDIIALADGINHAILTYGEVDQGLARLIEAGHVRREGVAFRPSLGVVTLVDSRSNRQLTFWAQKTLLEQFLGAPPWSEDYKPSQQSAGLVIPRQDYEAAVDDYRKGLK